MQLKVLKIHNIASIENAEIDFTKSPLSDSEVFLIAGKTGAGKSTLLDAICLALYGVTPRLQNTNMQGKVLDQQKEISVKDPEQMLRRSTGEGFITLTFNDNEGTPFEASWIITRAYKKPSGKLNDQKRFLKNEATGETLTKSKDINDEIKRVVGLDFSQFCRTTMLAQGEFSRFLNSKDSEKAEILEKITGTTIYSKIGSKIYEIFSSKEKDYKAIVDKIENADNLLSEEQIAQINEEINLLHKEHDKINSGIKEENLKKNWISEEIALKTKIKVASEEVTQAKEEIESEKFKEDKDKIKAWDLSAEARNFLKTIHDNEKKIKDAGEKINKLANSYSILFQGLNFENEKKNNAEIQAGEIDKFLSSCQEKKISLENAGNILIHLKNYKDGNKLIISEKDKIEENLKVIDLKFNPQLQKLEKEKEELSKLIEATKTKSNRKEEELQKLNLAGLRKQRDEVFQRKNALTNLKQYMEDYSSLETELHNKETSLKEIKKSLSDKEGEVTLQLTKDLQEAEKVFEVKKDIYESQKDTVDKFARLMRSRLHKGDNCPVCLQLITQDLNNKEDELNSIIEKLEKEKKEAEKIRDKVKDKINVNEIEIKSLKKESEKLSIEISDKLSSINSKKNSIEKTLVSLQFPVSSDNSEKSFDNIKNEIPVLIKKAETSIEKFDTQISKGEDLEKELKQIRIALDDARNKFDTKNSLISEVKDKITGINSKISASKRQIETKENEKNEIEKSLKLLLKEEFQENCLSRIDDYEIWLKKTSEEYKRNKERKIALENTIQQLSESLKSLESLRMRILNLMPEWENHESAQSQKVEKINDDFTTLLSKLTSYKDEIENLKIDSDLKNKSLETFFKENPAFDRQGLEQLLAVRLNEIDALRQEIDARQSRLTEAKARLDQDNKNLEQHILNKPDINPENDSIEKIDIRISEEENKLKDVGIKVGELKQQLETDKEQKAKFATLIEEAELKEKVYNKWLRLKNLIGDSKGDKFRKIAQSYVLESLAQTANHYMNTLSGRYTLKTRPESFLILVEDAFLGGSVRSAATLSGGETFLVSLSLALALSDIGAKLGVDTLFIDEGFGSLSGEPLQKAISTLRSLHSTTGKHVGIISHVEELREKIPVQIRVEKEGNNSASEIQIFPSFH